MKADGAVQDEEDVFYSDDDELEDAPPPPVDSKPHFRITGVHMAGLGKNDQPDSAASKHKKWGGQKQQVGTLNQQGFGVLGFYNLSVHKSFCSWQGSTRGGEGTEGNGGHAKMKPAVGGAEDLVVDFKFAFVVTL